MTPTSELKAAYEAAKAVPRREMRLTRAIRLEAAARAYIAALEADNARLRALVGKLEPYAILHAVRAGDFTLVAGDLELAPDADSPRDTDAAHVQP